MMKRNIIICICALWWLYLALCLSACRSLPGPTEKVVTKTEYVYRDRVERDTAFVHDSIFIRQKADSVFVDRWHTEYKERVRIDTAFVCNTDSVYIDRVEYIKRPRTFYDRFCSTAFWFIVILITAFIALKLYLKK